MPIFAGYNGFFSWPQALCCAYDVFRENISPDSYEFGNVILSNHKISKEFHFGEQDLGATHG